MGANTSRVSTVLVTNATAANTGTTAANIAADDILLLNRKGVQVADTGKVSDDGNDLVHVAATDAEGVLKLSNPIQVRNIRKVSITPYEATVQHKVTVPTTALPAAKLVADGEYGIAVIYQDNNRIFQEKPTREFFYFKAGASAPTKAQVLQGIADKINGAKLKQLSAAVTGAAGSEQLEISGVAVDTNGNGINQYQFRYFDVILRAGFDNTIAVVKAAGKPGKGIGLKIKDLEQATLYNQNRIQWPIQESAKKAASTGKYNLVTIEHGHEHIGDLQRPQVNPVTTIVAFETGVNATTSALEPSAKQTAFVTKLTSLVESAGVFVS